MKLITWIVALCNRKWQKELDAMVVLVETAEEPEVVEDVTDIIDSQPTHLSRKFRSRAKRKYSDQKPKAAVDKEEALAKTIKEELAKLA